MGKIGQKYTVCYQQEMADDSQERINRVFDLLLKNKDINYEYDEKRGQILQNK